MPNEATTRSINMINAPGGDYNLDDLFPNPENTLGTPDVSTTTPPAPPTQSVPPQTEPPKEFFLKTPTGTVYKTEEEAVKGFTHKDEVIEQLRQRYIQAFGIDPITNKPVAPPQAEISYLQDPKRLYNDMANAVAKQDPDGWTRALDRYIEEKINPYIAQAQPFVARAAQETAIEKVEKSYKDIRQWVGTQEYDQALEELPELRDAIAVASANIQYSAQLPGLYKAAYLASRGLKLPELLQQNTGAIQTQPQVRPTLSPSTQTPPPPAPVTNLAPGEIPRGEARKELIKHLETRVADIKW